MDNDSASSGSISLVSVIETAPDVTLHEGYTQRSGLPAKTQQPGPVNALKEVPAEERQRLEQNRKSGKAKYFWGLVPLLAIAGGLVFWQTMRGGEANAEAAGPPPVTSVELQPVSSVTVEDSSQFVGQLEAQQGVVLQAESQGRVTQIFVQPGQQVRAGEAIAQLSPDRSEAELRSAQADVRSELASRMNALAQLEVARANQTSAEADLRLQQQEMERTRTLVNQGVLPRQDLDMTERDIAAAQALLNAAQRQVAAARAMVNQADANIAAAQADAAAIEEDLNDFTVTAPIAGQVGDVAVKLGDYITPSSPLTTIVQNSSLDLEMAIPMERRNELRLGLSVEILGLEGEAIATGNIRFISPQADVNSQMVQAEATFSNTSGLLQDAQRVQARIIWNEGPGILVPTDSISRVAGAPFVYVAVPNPEVSNAEAGENVPELIAEQRSIQLGDIQDNQYQVTEGLQPGEEIVVSGILNLQDGSAIQSEQETAQN